MVKVIKLDNNNNYLIDTKSGNIVEKYDPENPNLELYLKLDDSELVVKSSNIKEEYGGNIIVQYNNDKFIIDDGYQPVMTKCGYIIYKDGDKIKYDIIEGRSILNSTFDKISKILEKDYNIDLSNEDQITISTTVDGYNYTIRFNTVESIVLKNHQRKDNSLKYYPFDKSMDKFATIYVSIFVEKLNSQGKLNNTIIDNLIKNLIYKLGSDYHFINLPIKGRILLHSDL